jgi:hypothetical protein
VKPGGALADWNGAVGFREGRQSQGVAPARGRLGVQGRLSRELFGECVAHFWLTIVNHMYKLYLMLASVNSTAEEEAPT